MKHFRLLAVLLFAFTTVLSAQNDTAALKTYIMKKLQSREIFEIEDGIRRLFDQYMPEAIPVLEKILWKVDISTSRFVFRELTKYKAPSLIPLAHEYLARIDTMKNNYPIPCRDLLEIKVAITMYLFDMNDFSTAHFVMEMVDRESPKTFSFESMLLRSILVHVPEYEERAKVELLRIINQTNDRYERWNAMYALDKKYGEKMLEFFKFQFDSSNEHSVRFAALDLLGKYDRPGIKSFFYSRFLVDTTFRWDICNKILEKYPILEAYRFMLNNLPNIGKDKQFIESLLETYEPPEPDSSATVGQMLQNLKIQLDTCYSYGWVGNNSFYLNLKDQLDAATTLLTLGDSCGCAVVIKSFSKMIYDGHSESLKSAEQFVEKGGWQFLFNNAQYVLEYVHLKGEPLRVRPKKIYLIL